jgi:glycosyltransferase involved in cell wall biosynthesis
MSGYLGIPRARIAVVPLGLDTSDFAELLGDHPRSRVAGHPTIGYLARLAPEKGLHILVDAFIHLTQKLRRGDVRLRIAGWLGEHNRPYVDQQLEKLRRAELINHVDLVGEVDRRGKLEFLKSIDLLCVPTTYREPKGLFVLEALAAGVPVIQPDHGSFPELLARTGGGMLSPPENAGALAEHLAQLLDDAELRSRLGRQGQAAVHRDFTAPRMAESTLAALQAFVALPPRTSKGDLRRP